MFERNHPVAASFLWMMVAPFFTFSLLVLLSVVKLAQIIYLKIVGRISA